MRMKVTAGLLVSIALLGSAQADTCPAVSEIEHDGTGQYTSREGQWKGTGETSFSRESLQFTEATLYSDRIVCTYESDGQEQQPPLVLIHMGSFTPGSSPESDSKWQNDQCSSGEYDPEQCAFTRQ